MDLQALTDFNLVAFHGGFGRASRASGRAKATLSRRVAELEQELGMRLVERGAQVLRLTEEGQALHVCTSGLLSELAEAGEAVALGAFVPRGRLRVSASVVFAHVVLGTVAARFAQDYPEVQLEIVAEDRKVDLVQDGYDLVIRVDPAPDEQLVGRRFMTDERVVVSAPRLALTAPATPEQSVPAVLLSATPPGTHWRVLFAHGERVLLPKPVLRLSSLLMVRDAVLAGAGAALLPRLLIAPDLAAGRLVSWGRPTSQPVEIWALQNSRRLVSAKVRTFLSTVERAVSENNVMEYPGYRGSSTVLAGK